MKRSGSSRVQAHRPLLILLMGIASALTGQPHAPAKMAQPEIQKGTSNPAPPSYAAAAALISPLVLAKIPRRARDSHGRPEDFVNVLILGSEQDVKQTFESAGWLAVNGTSVGPAKSLDAVQRLSNEAYLVRPLRGLILFGRPQDYSYALPALVTDIQARHYVRLWKNPAQVNGRTLWIGAAAHDTGPWWDSSTGEVSYRVDPNVDGERDLIRDTLTATGLVERSGYVRFDKSLKVSAQAGGYLQTDGRALVITLEDLPGK